jgi:hypothetical protein
MARQWPPDMRHPLGRRQTLLDGGQATQVHSDLKKAQGDDTLEHSLFGLRRCERRVGGLIALGKHMCVQIATTHMTSLPDAARGCSVVSRPVSSRRPVGVHCTVYTGGRRRLA